MQPFSVLLLVIGHVRSVQDRFYPLRVVKIPFNGVPKAFLKGDSRMPTQLFRDLRGIHGVSSVVPRPVGYKANEGSPGLAFERAQPLVQKITDEMDEIEILPLAVAADIVAFTGDPLF
jgi:hypothetical protein